MAFLRSLFFIFLALHVIISCREGEKSFEVDIEEGFPIRIEIGEIDSIPFAYSSQDGKPGYACFQNILIKNVSHDTLFVPLKIWWNSWDADDPNYASFYGHHSLFCDHIDFNEISPIDPFDAPDSLGRLLPGATFGTTITPWYAVSQIHPEWFKTIADSLKLNFHLYYGKEPYPFKQTKRVEIAYKRKSKSLVGVAAYYYKYK